MFAMEEDRKYHPVPLEFQSYHICSGIININLTGYAIGQSHHNTILLMNDLRDHIIKLVDL